MDFPPTPPADLDPAVRELFEAALAVHGHSYAPYSGFHVAAAIRTTTGRIFAGCNIENAAYPQSSCAEASAICGMVTAGEREIAEMVVICDGDDLGTCCGGCRQRIREFAALDVPLHMASVDGVRATFTVEELLPHSFGPEHLLGPAGAGAVP